MKMDFDPAVWGHRTGRYTFLPNPAITVRWLPWSRAWEVNFAGVRVVGPVKSARAARDIAERWWANGDMDH